MTLTLALTLVCPVLLLPQDGPRPRERSANATKLYRTSGGEATLWLDPAKWKPTESTSDAVMLFEHRTGLAQARLIVSSKPGTAQGLKQERLARLRSMDKKASIIYEKTLEVNGFPVLSVRLNASPDPRKPVVIWSYLYGDQERSVELFALVTPGVLSRLAGDLNEMLNGLDLAYSAEPIEP